jgi:hypothetical protein
MKHGSKELNDEIKRRFEASKKWDGKYNIVKGPDGQHYLNPSDFTLQQWKNGYTHKVAVGDGATFVWADENGYSPSFGVPKEDWYQNMGLEFPEQN